MLATPELAEKIEFIYREFSALCKNINKDILSVNYEIRNDTQELAVISHKDYGETKIDITALSKKSLAIKILENIF